MLDLLLNLLLLGGIKRFFGHTSDPMPFGVAFLMSIFGTVLGFVSLAVEPAHLFDEPLRLPLLIGAPVLLGALLVGWRHLTLKAEAEEEPEGVTAVTEVHPVELRDEGKAPEDVRGRYGSRGFALDAERFLGAVAFLMPLLAIRYLLGGMDSIW